VQNPFTVSLHINQDNDSFQEAFLVLLRHKTNTLQ
jgi:hypothetical protein